MVNDTCRTEGQDVLGKKLATGKANVVVRNMVYLGVGGAYA
jgi:hypothetical protein